MTYSAESEARKMEHLFHKELEKNYNNTQGPLRDAYNVALSFVAYQANKKLRNWKSVYKLTGPGYDESTPGEPWK